MRRPQAECKSHAENVYVKQYALTASSIMGTKPNNLKDQFHFTPQLSLPVFGQGVRKFYFYCTVIYRYLSKVVMSQYLPIQHSNQQCGTIQLFEISTPWKLKVAGDATS